MDEKLLELSKIDMKYGQILMDAEKIRTQSDYDDFYIANKQDAETQLFNAREFVAKIKEYINNSM